MKRIWIAVFIVSLGLYARAQEGVTTGLYDSPRDKVGLAVEPMLIYGQTTDHIRTSQLPIISEDTTATAKSGGVGVRLGAHAYKILTIGADARYFKTELSDSSYGVARGDNFTIGPTLGVQMPVAGLRLWGTYVVLGDFDPDPGARGFDVRFKDPRGFRVGAGFHIGPVSLNVEYQDLTYQNTEVQSYGLFSGSSESSVDFDSQGYMASLSFPMEI